MKPIEETHPSLKGKKWKLYFDYSETDMICEEHPKFNSNYSCSDETYYEDEDVQKHTVDKQILKELAKKWDSGLAHIGLDLFKELGLEEE